MGKQADEPSTTISSTSSRRDFIPLSIGEYEDGSVFTIEDEESMVDEIDTHFSILEQGLALQQKRRRQRRRCILCSFCFVALLVAIVPSSFVTWRSMLQKQPGSNAVVDDENDSGLASQELPISSNATEKATEPEAADSIVVKPPKPVTKNSSMASSQEVECSEGQEICFEVLSTIPHDPTSFTQGLTYFNGILYESTGQYGSSKVRKLDPVTGDVLLSVDMDGRYFGEGMTISDNHQLVQITWKEQQGFVYDSSTLQRTGDFVYTTNTNEGWGITYIPEWNQLVVSDGSEVLHFWNAADISNNFQEIKRVQVKRKDGSTIKNINELEYYHGWILANIWYSDIILQIHPETGVVAHEYDFSALRPLSERVGDVLNGISVSDKDGELFVTGKLWPKIYRVSLSGI